MNKITIANAKIAWTHAVNPKIQIFYTNDAGQQVFLSDQATLEQLSNKYQFPILSNERIDINVIIGRECFISYYTGLAKFERYV